MPGTPILKIAWFHPTLYQDRLERVQTTITAASQADACLQRYRLYTGVQSENPDFTAWLTLWRSKEEHDAHLLYQSDGIDAKDASRVIFIHPNDPITTFELAVKAPVTAMVEIRVKRVNASALGELGAVVEALKFALQSAGAHAAFCGKKGGDETVFVMIVGWDSVQAHQDAVRKNSNGGDLIERCLEISRIDSMKHATFSKFK